MRKKTHEEYVLELHLVNPNIEVVDKYIGNHKKILHRCKIDGYEWYIAPDNTLHNKGCPRCAGNAKKTHEEYVKEVAFINPNIDVLGVYVSDSTKILHKCKIDGHEWSAKPNNILHGKGCPICAGNILKTHTQYVQEVENINNNIDVIGAYINSLTPILHRCKIDGCEWLARPSSILDGQGCPSCCNSHGENVISRYLEERRIKFIPQYTFDDCRNKRKLPFDFYLLDYNICIEYDGIQHFQPIAIFGGEAAFEKQKVNDAIKDEYCKVNNINLIRIDYQQDVEYELDYYFNNTKLMTNKEE